MRAADCHPNITKPVAEITADRTFEMFKNEMRDLDELCRAYIRKWVRDQFLNDPVIQSILWGRSGHRAVVWEDVQ